MRMRRLGVVLFLCVSVVGVSFFLTRERELAKTGGNEAAGPAASPNSPDSDAKILVSGIAKRKVGGGAGADDAAPTAADQAKARTLEEILRSKNDNDPRLDRDFNGLTPGAKRLLRDRYARFAPERRNERGTIVFLLGRNLSSDADIDFMHGVLNEEACRSLADCARDAAAATTPGHDHGDDELGGAVTLAYPQLVALKSIERLLGAGQLGDGEVLAAARNELERARHSPVAKVASLAEDILGRLRK